MRSDRLLRTIPALLLALAAFGQDVQVTATVDADTVGVREQLQFTIRISGDGDAEPPRLPPFEGFDIVAGPSVSTQFQWVNGRTSSSKSFTYVLLPRKAGRYTLEPVEVRVGGKVYRTQPVEVVVTAAGSRPSRARVPSPFPDEDLLPRRQLGGEELFVSAEVEPRRAYPGQQVTLTFRLYTQVGVTGLELQESPALDGFWVEDMEVERDPRGVRKEVNGREYLEFVVKKQALFPTAPGKLRIPPVTFAVSARTAGDFFGLFGRSETLFRKTEELAVEVLPLPEIPAVVRDALADFAREHSCETRLWAALGSRWLLAPARWDPITSRPAWIGARRRSETRSRCA